MQRVSRSGMTILVACAMTAFGFGAWLSLVLVVVDGGEDYQAVGFAAVRGLIIVATLILVAGVVLLARCRAALRHVRGMANAGSMAVGGGLGVAVVAFQFYASAGTLVSENARYEYVEPSAVQYVLVLVGILLTVTGILILLLSPFSRRPSGAVQREPIRS